MDTSVEGIIVNNCQIAPIYLIQHPGTNQPNTYVLAPNNAEQAKPISNNLKTFYENSGNIENGLVNVEVAVRPTAKKKDSILIGNNLGLASFLLPKNDNVNKQYVVDNIVLKPNVNTNPSPPLPVNIVPKIDIDRKIVKLKQIPIMSRTRVDKVLPKIKPKEGAAVPQRAKHTSVQLIKLGETYHSVNQLDADQMKMVKHALRMFKEPQCASEEGTYDPLTNTNYIYKVVSPKDLTVVGRKKITMKDKKLTKVPRKVIEDKLLKRATPVKELEEETPPEPEPPVETKVTRSGRKVKLPKQILPEDSPHKCKKKTGTIVSCFQCSAEFGSLYRLQKHYENHPTHIPAKIHSNLFHCLLAIIKSGSDTDKTNIFIQQLEQLVVKLKSLLPCLLSGAGRACTVGDEVGRLFGVDPGKYKLDVDALNCVKDKDGYCIHNPPKCSQDAKDEPSAPPGPKDDALNAESESENCARINSVAKWPTVSKRIWRLKQKTDQLSPKKMRLKSEGDALVSAGAPPPERGAQAAGAALEGEPFKNNYVQFHSAHFDIRSSPIKSSSTVFRKFQINPSKMSHHPVQAMRPLELVHGEHRDTLANTDTSAASEGADATVLSNCDSELHACASGAEDEPSAEITLGAPPPEAEELHATLECTAGAPLSSTENSLDIALHNTDNSLHDMFKSEVDIACKDESTIDSALKDWIISSSEKCAAAAQTGYKSDGLTAATAQGESVLNFLDNLGNDLVYPETDLRTNGVDFHLDLFTFHNSV